ncbi:MAG: hypothetical protein ACI8U4_002656 [Natronomonas sp.]
MVENSIPASWGLRAEGSILSYLSETPLNMSTDTERQLGHEEFDPVGTVVLIAIYFLILVGMWIFTYFIEFLGNGPTVIG